MIGQRVAFLGAVILAITGCGTLASRKTTEVQVRPTPHAPPSLAARSLKQAKEGPTLVACWSGPGGHRPRAAFDPAI